GGRRARGGGGQSGRLRRRPLRLRLRLGLALVFLGAAGRVFRGGDRAAQLLARRARHRGAASARIELKVLLVVGERARLVAGQLVHLGDIEEELRLPEELVGGGVLCPRGLVG